MSATQAYHGEPAPALTAAIWAEAERRYPEPTQQSIFNDACHWLIQRVKGAMADVNRLTDLEKKVRVEGGWHDEAAFKKFSDDLREAYRKAEKALVEIAGDNVENLWYIAPEAHDFTHRELVSHLNWAALARKSYPKEYAVAERLYRSIDQGCDGTCKDLGGCPTESEW